MRRTWIALVLTVVLLAVLLYLTDYAAIADSFRRLSPAAALAGLFVWALTNLLRAFRFRALVLSREVTPVRMLSIVNVQNFLANLTPGRAGELSYVVLLRQNGKVPGAEGLGGLVLARVFDLVIVCGVAVVALIAARDALPRGSGTVVVTVAAMFAGSVFLLLQLAWLSERGIRLLGALMRATGADRWSAARRLAAKAEDVHAYIVTVQGAGGALRIWLLTAGIWITSYAVSWIWLWGAGLALSPEKVIFVAAVAGFAGSLPIQGVAGLGTIEAGWAIPLVLVGVGREEAIGVAFCLHALAILYLGILGGAGALHLALTREAGPVSQTSK